MITNVVLILAGARGQSLGQEYMLVLMGEDLLWTSQTSQCYEVRVKPGLGGGDLPFSEPLTQRWLLTIANIASLEMNLTKYFQAWKKESIF